MTTTTTGIEPDSQPTRHAAPDAGLDSRNAATEPRSNGAVHGASGASQPSSKRSAILAALQAEPDGTCAAIAARVGCTPRYVRTLRPPTPPKVRSAVIAMLSDAWTARLSNGQIARHIGCSPAYVGKLRRSAPDLRPKLMPDDKMRLVTRSGVRKQYLMNTTFIGRSK